MLLSSRKAVPFVIPQRSEGICFFFACHLERSEGSPHFALAVAARADARYIQALGKRSDKIRKPKAWVSAVKNPKPKA